MSYSTKEIEKKWQQKWEETKLYQTKEDDQKPKFYCLEQFPYPSGNLHMGHMRVYSLGDVIARYKRMKGYNVFHPIGWDSFGLPAENAAIKSGVHPAKWTYENIEVMKNQLKTIGVSYDWEKEVTTCSPDYYQFNQWLFLLFYEKGLAYRKKAPVNWCESCHTTLANEQVINEKCWRCDHEVVKKDLDQWFLKITDYADELLDDLDDLDGWDEKVKTMQRNWIGKSGTTNPTYRLHDWLISRQRYWGTPIPIIYCGDCGIVPEKKENLPLVLPMDVEFDKGINPLQTSEDFVSTTCPTCGGKAKRETDTMDTFIDSSWYYLRYTDNQNEHIPFSSEKVNKWMEVDEYVGGIEHAILHLLYSRFFTKVLHDEGMVKTKEPFKKLLAQGMVLKDGKKMSKSLGNVVSPTEIIEEYGADTCRFFILSAAAPDQDFDWKDLEVKGTSLFLQELYSLVKTSVNKDVIKDETTQTKEFRRVIHQTIKKITECIEKRKFNIVQSCIHSLLNKAEELKISPQHEVFSEATDAIILLLAPFVPHLTEELWYMKGHTTSVHEEKWIAWDEELIFENEIELPVQVNGRIRGKIKVKLEENEESIKEKALAAVTHFIKDQQVKQIRVIPKKIISIVI